MLKTKSVRISKCEYTSRTSENSARAIDDNKSLSRTSCPKVLCLSVPFDSVNLIQSCLKQPASCHLSLRTLESPNWKQMSLPKTHFWLRFSTKEHDYLTGGQRRTQSVHWPFCEPSAEERPTNWFRFTLGQSNNLVYLERAVANDRILPGKGFPSSSGSANSKRKRWTFCIKSWLQCSLTWNPQCGSMFSLAEQTGRFRILFVRSRALVRTVIQSVFQYLCKTEIK